MIRDAGGSLEPLFEVDAEAWQAFCEALPCTARDLKRAGRVEQVSASAAAAILGMPEMGSAEKAGYAGLNGLRAKWARSRLARGWK